MKTILRTGRDEIFNDELKIYFDKNVVDGQSYKISAIFEAWPQAELWACLKKKAVMGFKHLEFNTPINET